jgi:uncharacterized protein (TIGR00661 family)
LIEHLRVRHRVVVLTFGQTWEMLTPHYPAGLRDVELRRIPGLRFGYSASGKVSLLRTLAGGVSFALRLPWRVRALAAELSATPDALVLSDFEPLTLRAAERAGVRAMCIDHQRLLQVCDLTALPWLLRLAAFVMSSIVQWVFGTPKGILVSGFHLPQLKAEYQNVLTAGVLIRPELEKVQPSHAPHLVAYLRRDCSERLLKVFEGCSRPVKLYGLGSRPAQGSLSFYEVDTERFIRDLASCTAVITTAGNQLIGEAFYLKKPVLAFPEPGNFEQRINAHLLNSSKGGLALDADELSRERLETFLRELEVYRAQIEPNEVYGNTHVLHCLDDWISGRKRSAPSCRASFTSDGFSAKIENRSTRLN